MIWLACLSGSGSLGEHPKPTMWIKRYFAFSRLISFLFFLPSLASFTLFELLILVPLHTTIAQSGKFSKLESIFLSSTKSFCQKKLNILRRKKATLTCRKMSDVLTTPNFSPLPKLGISSTLSNIDKNDIAKLTRHSTTKTKSANLLRTKTNFG